MHWVKKPLWKSFYKTKFYHNQKPFKSRKESIDDPNWIKLHLTLKNILGFVVFQNTRFFLFDTFSKCSNVGLAFSWLDASPAEAIRTRPKSAPVWSWTDRPIRHCGWYSTGSRESVWILSYKYVYIKLCKTISTK